MEFVEGVGEGARELDGIVDKAKPQLVAIRIRDGGSSAYVHENQLRGLGVSYMEAVLLTHLIAAPLSSPIAKSPIIPTKAEQFVSIAALCQANITDQRLRYIHMEEDGKQAVSTCKASQELSKSGDLTSPKRIGEGATQRTPHGMPDMQHPEAGNKLCGHS